MPFWSPDSRRVGFVAKGKLRTLDIGSGAVQILSDAQPGGGNRNTGGSGGAWNPNGTIVFLQSVTGPLYRISETGGVAEPVTKIGSGSAQSHLYTFFLPDGKRFLYTVESRSPEGKEPEGLYVGALDMSAPKLISRGTGRECRLRLRIAHLSARTHAVGVPFDPTARNYRAACPVSGGNGDRCPVVGILSIAATECWSFSL